MKSAYSDRITSNPSVCSGQPAIGGTRIRIKVMLDNLAEGHSMEDILRFYPGLVTS
jgi:uncharacterized protein (DUF433 family)